jgi:hypothetical protein
MMASRTRLANGHMRRRRRVMRQASDPSHGARAPVATAAHFGSDLGLVNAPAPTPSPRAAGRAGVVPAAGAAGGRTVERGREKK